MLGLEFFLVQMICSLVSNREKQIIQNNRDLIVFLMPAESLKQLPVLKQFSEEKRNFKFSKDDWWVVKKRHIYSRMRFLWMVPQYIITFHI